MVHWSNLRLLLIAIWASSASAEPVPVPVPALDPGVELVTPPVTPAVRPKDRRTLSLSIVPRANHRLHPHAPITVRVSGHGIDLPRPLFARTDAVDPRAEIPRFEIPTIINTPRSADVRALCSFWLCRGERCRPVEIEARWSLSPPSPVTPSDGGAP